MSTLKLSVVIATKNRPYYCIEAVKSILSNRNSNFELVISDNSDDHIVYNFANSIKDIRLNYVYTEGTLSQSENYNICLNKATGLYVCLLGDDDTILPEIFKAVDFAIDNDVDAIGQKDVIDYLWPSNNSPGFARIPRYSRRIFKLDSGEVLRKYLKGGACYNPRDAKLPMLYHGIVKRSLLEQIKNETGEFLTGISPDSYSACAIAQRIRIHYIYDIPFSVAGVCQSSASASKLMGGHRGELSESPQYVLHEKKGYLWSNRIPRFYTVETIWADSALHNINDNILQYFYLYPLVAKAIFSNFDIRRVIIKYTNIQLKENKKGVVLFYFKVIFCIIFRFVSKIIGKFIRVILRSDRRFYNVKHIDSVFLLLNQ